VNGSSSDGRPDGVDAETVNGASRTRAPSRPWAISIQARCDASSPSARTPRRGGDLSGDVSSRFALPNAAPGYPPAGARSGLRVQRKRWWSRVFRGHHPGAAGDAGSSALIRAIWAETSHHWSDHRLGTRVPRGGIQP
jgi:hypothetical protein